MTKERAMRWLAAVAFLIPAAAWAQATHPAVAAPDLAALVKQLAAADFSVRTHAQEALDRLDVAAMPELQRLAAAERDPEVQAHLAAALVRLEDDAALLPTRVSWDFHEATRAEVVAAIEKAIGRKIDVRDEKGPDAIPVPERVTCHVENKPFWEAMAPLSEAAGFTVEHPQPWSGAISVVFGRKSDLSAMQVHGGFAWISQPWVFKGATAEQGIVRPITCLVDPHLQVIGGNGLTLSSAIDDQGVSLLPELPERRMMSMWTGMVYPVFVLPLKRGTGKTVSIRGLRKFIVTTREETADVTPEVGRIYSIAGQRVRVDRFISTPGKLDVSLDFQGREGGAADSGLRFCYGHFLVRDGQGQVLEDVPLIFGGPSGGFLIEKELPAGFTCRLVLTARTRTVEVPFEFKDLPLPEVKETQGK
jgi:hypothetical protein